MPLIKHELRCKVVAKSRWADPNHPHVFYEESWPSRTLTGVIPAVCPYRAKILPFVEGFWITSVRSRKRCSIPESVIRGDEYMDMTEPSAESVIDLTMAGWKLDGEKWKSIRSMGLALIADAVRLKPAVYPFLSAKFDIQPLAPGPAPDAYKPTVYLRRSGLLQRGFFGTRRYGFVEFARGGNVR